ncbi:DUF4836 family protein [Candidatus Uabimicrobium sp. HlEnr_7]|uniref:DUF4836 family protein n=1 Tax=Candidatus Uabimicrobium helgolandensis TaxID=3095367 RepID=UPI0035584E41
MNRTIFFFAFLICTYAQDVVFPKVFPKDTFAVVSCSDVKKLSEKVVTTNMFNLITHPELSHLKNNQNFSKLLRDFSANFEFASNLNLHQLWDLFAGEISVALTDVPNGSKPPQMVAVIRIAHKKNLEKLLERVTSKIPEWKHEITLSGHKVQFLKGLENAYYYTLVDDYLFVTTGKSLMQNMLNNWKNPSNNLQKNSEFTKYYDKVKRPNSLFLYLNVERLVNSIIRLSADGGLKNILQALGVRDWRNCGISFAVDDAKILTQFYINIRRKIDAKRILDPSKLLKKRFSFRDLLREKKKLEDRLKNATLLGNARGINVFLPSGELDLAISKFIPKNTWGMVALHWEIAKIWHEIHRAAKKIEPHSYKEVQGYLQQTEQTFFGFRLQDFFDSLGSNYALFHLPQSLQKIPPRFIAAIEIKKHKEFRSYIENFLSIYGYKLVSRSYRGQQIFHMESKKNYYHGGYGHSEIRKILRVLFGNFAFYKDGKYLVFSRFPQNLMDVIDHVADKHPAFELESLGKLPFSFACYIDWKQVIPPVYSTMLSFPHFLEDKLRIESSDLPRASTFLEYCDRDVITMHNKRGALHGKIHSNFGVELPLFALGFAFLIDEMWSPGVDGMIDEFLYYLKANKKSSELVDKKRYYEALQLWEKTFYFEYFRRIAKQEQKYISGLYKAYQTKIQKQLRSHFNNSHLQSWRVKGDWQFENNILKGHNTSSSYYNPITVTTGTEDMSDYILSFEVKGIEQNMNVNFHCDNNDIGNTVTIPQINALKERWVPWKFKVHKKRITYWRGIKHLEVLSTSESGRIRFSLPQNAKTQIRNIKLHIPKKIQVVPAKKPVIVLECYDTVDPLPKGQIGTFCIAITNAGEIPVENISVIVKTSSNIKLSNLQQIPTFTLQSQQSKTHRFQAVALEAGSATFEAFVRYKGQTTKILLKEYTYVNER